jgi:hypothetical protein
VPCAPVVAAVCASRALLRPGAQPTSKAPSAATADAAAIILLMRI